MRARRRSFRHGLVRWAVAAAMLLAGGATVACAAEPAPRATVAAPVSTKVETGAGEISTPEPLVVPGWLPAELPLPANAQVTAVNAAQCAVSFVAPGTQAEQMSGLLAQQAREAGLVVRVVSSVSTTPPPVTPVDDLFGDGAEELAPPETHAVVLELGDSLLTLTSSGDGMVFGAYDLPVDSCGG